MQVNETTGQSPPPSPPKKLLLHYGFASRAPYANLMQINLAWLIMAFVGKPHWTWALIAKIDKRHVQRIMETKAKVAKVEVMYLFSVLLPLSAKYLMLIVALAVI